MTIIVIISVVIAVLVALAVAFVLSGGARRHEQQGRSHKELHRDESNTSEQS